MSSNIHFHIGTLTPRRRRWKAEKENASQSECIKFEIRNKTWNLPSTLCWKKKGENFFSEKTTPNGTQPAKYTSYTVQELDGCKVEKLQTVHALTSHTVWQCYHFPAVFPVIELRLYSSGQWSRPLLLNSRTLWRIFFCHRMLGTPVSVKEHESRTSSHLLWFYSKAFNIIFV